MSIEIRRDVFKHFFDRANQFQVPSYSSSIYSDYPLNICVYIYVDVLVDAIASFLKTLRLIEQIKT